MCGLRSTGIRNQWKSGTEAPRLTSTGIGTWLAGASYRYRDRNSDPESDDSGVYGGDGPGVSIGLLQRLDAFQDRHRVYLETVFAATHSNDEPAGITGFLSHAMNWFAPESGLRFSGFMTSACQEIDDNAEWRYKFQGDVRRSFDLAPAFSITGSLGGFVTRQSLDAESIQALENRPHPALYSDFDDRHDAGATARVLVTARPASPFRIHGYLKTITAGDGESGVLGPWWAGIGADAMVGPVVVGLSYEQRSAFGDSSEPDRSRLEAVVSAYHWQANHSLWEIKAFHRTTFDENWNDTGLNVSVRFGRGRIFRDIDPFRMLFKDRIEALTD